MNDLIEQFRHAMAAAGLVPPDTIEVGKLHRFSSNGRKADTSGWCRLLLSGQVGYFGDFRRDFSSMWTARDDRAPTLVERQQRADELQRARAEAAVAQAIQWARAANRNASLWDRSSPLKHGDPVIHYLDARGICLQVLPQALRCHPGLDYWADGRCIGQFPAMIGAVTDAAGQMVSLHRTYLTHDGRKADVGVVKKLTSSSARLIGCSIKLGHPASIKGAMSIGVAEGVETALACTTASSMPTESAISAGGLERYEWPKGVQSLIVFADNDVSQVGQHAAAALALRARRNGLVVRVLTPPQAGTDWADVWVAQTEGV